MPKKQRPPDISIIHLKFQDVINTNDPTFNQELGINDFGVIAGYFGSGAAGHPNKGYTIVLSGAKVSQADFINENFPGSVQTQVTGINSRGLVFIGATITVGFWSDSNNASGVNNNFGFINIGGQSGTFINVNNPNTGTIKALSKPQTIAATHRRRGVHI